MDKRLFWFISLAAVVVGTTAGITVEFATTGAVTFPTAAVCFVVSFFGPAMLLFIMWLEQAR